MVKWGLIKNKMEVTVLAGQRQLLQDVENIKLWRGLFNNKRDDARKEEIVNRAVSNALADYLNARTNEVAWI